MLISATDSSGEVISCRVLRDDQGVSRGVGLARMETPEQCDLVIRRLNGAVLPGMAEPIHIKHANTQSPRRTNFVHRGPARPPSAPTLPPALAAQFHVFDPPLSAGPISPRSIVSPTQPLAHHRYAGYDASHENELSSVFNEAINRSGAYGGRPPPQSPHIRYPSAGPQGDDGLGGFGGSSQGRSSGSFSPAVGTGVYRSGSVSLEKKSEDG